MKNDDAKKDYPDRDSIRIASVAAVAVGLIVAAFLFIETGKEHYSALYLKPGSYSNYLDGNLVSFTYGVQCFEAARTQYQLKVTVNDRFITQRDFSIEGRGKVSEDHISFELPPDTSFPAKVALLLSANGNDYETYFWIRGRK